MKEKIKVLILMGIIAFSACGCGNAKTEEADLAETQMIQKESVKDAETEEGTEDNEQTEATEMETADAFSFADFSRLEFLFASGASGWATILTVDADGSFVGSAAMTFRPLRIQSFRFTGCTMRWSNVDFRAMILWRI